MAGSSIAPLLDQAAEPIDLARRAGRVHKALLRPSEDRCVVVADRMLRANNDAGGDPAGVVVSLGTDSGNAGHDDHVPSTWWTTWASSARPNGFTR
jgi:hypothetical protein